MGFMPLISIVVITYNSENTVVETLKSICVQTYPNKEIIVCDDGSLDNTQEIVREFFKETCIPYSLLFSKYNVGVTKNCNKGIKAAKGDYIKVIAGDDVFLPDAIVTYVKYLPKNNVIYTFDIVPFGEVQQKVNAVRENIQKNLYFYDLNHRQQYKALIRENIVASPGVGVIPRRLYREMGYYDERYDMMEDYPFLLSLSRMGYVFRRIDEPVISYRISSASLSGETNKKSRLFKSCRKFFMKVRLIELLKAGSFVEAFKQFIYFYVVL